MKSLRWILSLVAIVMLIITFTACKNIDKNVSKVSNSEKQVVKIAYLPITHALPLYVQKEMAEQFSKNIKIELIKFGSWPELVDALKTGNVDGASMLIELAMKAKEQGIDLKAVALGHRDGNVVVVSHNINKTTDLRNKTFAIPHRLSTHNILLYKMLKEAKMNYSDLKVIELPPPEMPAALSEGRIAGYIVAEPFGAKSVANRKGKVLYQSKDIWKNSICCVLALRNDFIKNKTVAAKEFINGYLSAGRYIDSKDNKVDDIAKKYMNVDQNVLHLSMKWISYNDLKIYKNDYNYLRNYLIEMGLSKNPPLYDDFVDSSIIDKVKR